MVALGPVANARKELGKKNFDELLLLFSVRSETEMIYWHLYIFFRPSDVSEKGERVHSPYQVRVAGGFSGESCWANGKNSASNLKYMR